MFSEMITALRDNREVPPGPLRTRFDFALTKKMGVLQLPPSFWQRDPKINPNSSHLFWAALLLKDRERIDLAVAVIRAELVESVSCRAEARHEMVDRRTGELMRELLAQFTDAAARKNLEDALHLINPGWFAG